MIIDIQFLGVGRTLRIHHSSALDQRAARKIPQARNGFG
jgi:hypothetical protein